MSRLRRWALRTHGWRRWWRASWPAGRAAAAAGVVRAGLAGRPGPAGSWVLRYAVAGLVAVDLEAECLFVTPMHEAFARAAHAIASGAAAAVLGRWVSLSRA